MTKNSLLQKEIDKLRQRLLLLGGKVEENLWNAVRSLKRRDPALAERVVGTDEEIDRMEVDLEEECLKILALHQPVAVDLRFIIAVLKMNNDLERIGDLAVNIAEHSVFLSNASAIAAPFDLALMADKTLAMLRNSLDALVNMNVSSAFAVCAADDEVDEINRQMYRSVIESIRKDPSQTETMLHYLGLSRCMERIADQSTNIAEDVIYFADGEIIRHNRRIAIEGSNRRG